MDNRKTISEIAACVASEMERLQYAPPTIKQFQISARHFEEYVIAKAGDSFFNEEIGTLYLQETIGFPFDEARPMTTQESGYVRCVRRIGEYQLHGIVSRLRYKTYTETDRWGMDDTHIINAYIEAAQTADNSDATKKLRYHHIQKFYCFLDSCSLTGIQGISPQIISLFAESLQGYSPVYVKHILGTLRNYFRFVSQKGFCTQDWSGCVPSVMAAKNTTIPALWSQSDIERILNSVDRGSPCGKRDYAIILLVVQLGVRIADVANLRLDALKWERKQIEFTQHKTHKTVTLPLLDDVGWAIIDYIRHGRPKTEEPTIFVSVSAPYRNISPSAVGSILSRQIQRCGISKNPGTVSGMHSLRHALARRLLESGTPLPTVAEIMGHSSFSSTSPYLKVDISSLRECSLSVMGDVCHD